MTIYRITVTIPSEIYLEAGNVQQAADFMQFLQQRYDRVEYPISTNSDDRTGSAEVKVLAIEPARADDCIHEKNATEAAMHQPVGPDGVA